MPFDAPAEPSKFPEAVSWFRQLIPMTQAQFDTLHVEERGRAFTVAGAEQLQVVQTLHEEIARSIETGEPFEAFAKRAKDLLKDRWANASSARLETVFRTNVQTSYGVGRWYQQQDPEVTAVRKFMMFDGVDDSRQSQICRDRNNIIKRHDDPYVAANWPPLHQRCRSQWQSISERKARRLGGETPFGDEGDVPVGEGFGLAPPFRSDWRPDPAKYDPKLMAIHDAKVAEMRDQI